MITVWGRDNSTNVQKVFWCLEELDLPWETIPAGAQYGLNHDEQYLVMNPNGLVPCLRDSAHNLILWESNTIVRYLAAQYGQGWLWEANPARRAESEKWMDWTSGTLTEPFKAVYLSLVRLPAEERDPAYIAQGIEKLQAAMAILDHELASRTWLGSEQFSPADISAGPFIYRAFNLDIRWGEYPHLRRWYHQLCERPGFQTRVMLPLS